MADRIRVARIGAAHGVRGEVKLWSFTQDPAAVAHYGPLQSEDGKQLFEIDTMRAAKDHFVARIAGVDSREAAQALCNVELFISRAKLPPIDEPDTFYHADLVGMAAVTPEGTPLGNVTALHNFGAGELIEIATIAGGEPLLLPFTEAIVPKIDMALRQVVIVLPTVIE